MEKSRAIELLEHLSWDRDIDRNPYGDALNIAIDALKSQLSQESMTKDATSDTISKTETVERLRGVIAITMPITDYDGGFIDGIESGISTVSTMPPTPPERKKGKWMPQKEGGLCCSECGGYALDVSDGNFIHIAVQSYFCPHCGARMKGAQNE